MVPGLVCIDCQYLHWANSSRPFQSSILPCTFPGRIRAFHQQQWIYIQRVVLHKRQKKKKKNSILLLKPHLDTYCQCPLRAGRYLVVPPFSRVKGNAIVLERWDWEILWISRMRKHRDSQANRCDRNCVYTCCQRLIDWLYIFLQSPKFNVTGRVHKKAAKMTSVKKQETSIVEY